MSDKIWQVFIKYSWALPKLLEVKSQNFYWKAKVQNNYVEVLADISHCKQLINFRNEEW